MSKEKAVNIGPYTFYFKHISYDDYLSHGWDRHDAHHMESVLYSCVRGYIATESDNEVKQLNIEDFEYEPGILVSLVDYIYEVSGYDEISSPEKMVKNIKIMQTYLMTKQGVYDAFIFHHLGMDAWIKSRESPDIRFYLISIAQLLTGIDVDRRWEEAQKNNEPLDIVNNDEQRQAMAEEEARNPKSRRRAISEQMEKKARESGLTESVAHQVQGELKKKLKMDKERFQNRKVAFDWQSDLASEQAITREETSAYSRLHHSKESEEFNL